MKASDTTVAILDQKVKEPSTLLFFRGAIYEFTYNCNEQFSQAQMALLFDVPSQDTLDRFKKFEILAAPPGTNDIGEFDESYDKQHYINLGFKPVKIGVCPEYTQSIKHDTQAIQKQYGLKHCVTSTIHAFMGDTLTKAAIEISRHDSSFKLWDCAQVIVVLSRTKLGKNLIFVGDKKESVDACAELIQTRAQWTDYMESILNIVTVNNNNNQSEHQSSIPSINPTTNYPYRICDLPLPQCNTGFVYMLMSIRRKTYTYIGETDNIRQRIKQHNSGHGSQSTEPSFLCPFAVIAYICGFNGERTLRRYIERQ